MTLVTCLCLTRNRRQWLPKAIECYQAQTYPHRELLILADGESVKDLVPDDPTIRLVESDTAPTIGQKRNLGVTHASGELICHWDDDDYSAPERLADQVERLLSSGKAVTGYNTMRFTDGEKAWMYIGPKEMALGTSLCYRRAWALANPFVNKQIAEDNEFVRQAQRAKQLISVESERRRTPETPAYIFMHAAVHEGNTSLKRVDRWKQVA